jgi:hypothetical protein
MPQRLGETTPMLKRKFSILVSLLALFAVSAQAHELEGIMKSMLERQKALVAQANKPELNPSSADLVRELRTLQFDAIRYEPHKGMHMADPLERRKFLAAYQQAMAQAIASLSELELAFLNNDATAISAGMAKMKLDKEQGHKRFKSEQ